MGPIQEQKVSHEQGIPTRLIVTTGPMTGPFEENRFLLVREIRRHVFSLGINVVF